MKVVLTVEEVIRVYNTLPDDDPLIEGLRNTLIEFFYDNISDFTERRQIITALYHQGELIELYENHKHVPVGAPLIISSRTFDLLFSIILDTEDEVLLNHVLRTTMPTPMEAIELIAYNQEKLLSNYPDEILTSYDAKKLYFCSIALSYVVNHRQINKVNVRVPDELNIAIGCDTTAHV